MDRMRGGRAHRRPIPLGSSERRLPGDRNPRNAPSTPTCRRGDHPRPQAHLASFSGADQGCSPASAFAYQGGAERPYSWGKEGARKRRSRLCPKRCSGGRRCGACSLRPFANGFVDSSVLPLPSLQFCRGRRSVSRGCAQPSVGLPAPGGRLGRSSAHGAFWSDSCHAKPPSWLIDSRGPRACPLVVWDRAPNRILAFVRFEPSARCAKHARRRRRGTGTESGGRLPEGGCGGAAGPCPVTLSGLAILRGSELSPFEPHADGRRARRRQIGASPSGFVHLDTRRLARRASRLVARLAAPGFRRTTTQGTHDRRRGRARRSP
jgi:hypothetical protein